jgi:hypothetical protein
MTNIEVWRTVCAALGEDPGGLVVEGGQAAAWMWLHADRAGEAVKTDQRLCNWLSFAMTWRLQPRGHAWWAAVVESLTLDAHDSLADADGVRSARGVLRVFKAAGL